MIFNLLSFLTLPSFEKVKDLITTVYPENKFTIEVFFFFYKCYLVILSHLPNYKILSRDHQTEIPKENSLSFVPNVLGDK